MRRSKKLYGRPYTAAASTAASEVADDERAGPSLDGRRHRGATPVLMLRIPPRSDMEPSAERHGGTSRVIRPCLIPHESVTCTRDRAARLAGEEAASLCREQRQPGLTCCGPGGAAGATGGLVSAP